MEEVLKEKKKRVKMELKENWKEKVYDEKQDL